MTISGRTFDSAGFSDNPEVLDLFMTHPSKAYSREYLERRFGLDVDYDLIMLQVNGKVESKFNGRKGTWYYRLKGT